MTKEEKQKAIDALKISTPVMVVTQEQYDEYVQILNKIKNWLEQEETVTEFADRCRECGKIRWTPVSEGPPKENQTVIASTKYGVYPEARYSKEYGWEWAYEAGADYWRELKDVEAWMPLPKPYEPQESEQDPCDTCGYEEGSIYCKEHCPHEAKVINEDISKGFEEFTRIMFKQGEQERRK